MADGPQEGDQTDMKKKKLKELVATYSEDIKALDHGLAALETRVEELIKFIDKNTGVRSHLSDKGA